MATKYSEEFKSSIIARLLPPHNVSVPDMVKETGVPKDTLYTWRNQYRNKQVPAQSSGNHPASSLNNEEKLAIVIESASLTEVELGEYCRRKGLWLSLRGRHYQPILQTKKIILLIQLRTVLDKFHYYCAF